MSLSIGWQFGHQVASSVSLLNIQMNALYGASTFLCISQSLSCVWLLCRYGKRIRICRITNNVLALSSCDLKNQPYFQSQQHSYKYQSAVKRTCNRRQPQQRKQFCKIRRSTAARFVTIELQGKILSTTLSLAFFDFLQSALNLLTLTGIFTLEFYWSDFQVATFTKLWPQYPNKDSSSHQSIATAEH